MWHQSNQRDHAVFRSNLQLKTMYFIFYKKTVNLFQFALFNLGIKEFLLGEGYHRNEGACSRCTGCPSCCRNSKCESSWREWKADCPTLYRKWHTNVYPVERAELDTEDEQYIAQYWTYYWKGITIILSPLLSCALLQPYLDIGELH